MNKNAHWKARIFGKWHFSIKILFLKNLSYVNEIWEAEETKISLIWEAAFFFKDTDLWEEQYREIVSFK